MAKNFFMQTDRIKFSVWTSSDMELAKLLWGNAEVTKYICANGTFSIDDIRNRLNQEIQNNKQYGIQYWQIYELTTTAFIGCCGLRPHQENSYEIGFHLLPEFWGKGYATEAAKAVITYAFTRLSADKLFAGHNPKNVNSPRILARLGFHYIGDEYYAPTGLYHPSYELINPQKIPIIP
ncbi:MAG: GNAT family N-acetyltransferase [Lachnospiraceae bacterium]|nr:GNAT family N-acetyltransferase [Lachnospiraceae bacterium]